MDEYACITVQSKPGESQADFSARLSRFWTHMLRNRKGDFEKVYAETTKFIPHGARVGSRRPEHRDSTASSIRYPLRRAVNHDCTESTDEGKPPESLNGPIHSRLRLLKSGAMIADAR